MIIRIGDHNNPAVVHLTEADRLDRLHVEAEAGATHSQIDAALRRAAAGSFADGAAGPLIFADWIRGQCGDDDGPWATAFGAMLDHAEKKGWYSPAGGAIEAHVEYRDREAAAVPAIRQGLAADEFRAAFRGHPAGVAVITADDGSGPVGLTATSVFSVSAEPPLLVFSVSHISSSSPTITASESVVVHLLSVRDLWLAKLCATSGIDRFADTSTWSRLPTGEPYFPAASRWLRAAVVSTALAGTSTIVTAQALESGSGLDDDHINEAPLVYHNRTWHALRRHSELEVRVG
ncbi:flavin reductase family protein [Agromyces bauzanensis]